MGLAGVGLISRGGKHKERQRNPNDVDSFFFFEALPGHGAHFEMNQNNTALLLVFSGHCQSSFSPSLCFILCTVATLVATACRREDIRNRLKNKKNHRPRSHERLKLASRERTRETQNNLDLWKPNNSSLTLLFLPKEVF